MSSTSLQTLNSGDRLDGGAGTDEIVATINTAVTPTTFANIESVSATFTAAVALDLSTATGLNSVTIQGSTNAAATANVVQGISNTVAVTVRDSAGGTTITRTDLSGTADATTVNLMNMSQATGTVLSLNGTETLTLNSSSGASVIGTLTDTSLTKLVITGDKALTIIDAFPTTTPVLTVDASAHTAVDGLGVVFTGGFNLGAMTTTGGAGNDTFTFLAAGNVSATGGAGNDTLVFAAIKVLVRTD